MQLFATGTILRHERGPLILAVALAALVFALRINSEGYPEMGDGSLHFLHARYFWNHAFVALSQWGKPVFSLVASPFTLLGFWGPALMNSLVAVLTCWVIMRCLGDRGSLWSWAVPILLFSSPMYVYTVATGMTEPLFGLLAMGVVLLLVRERFAFAMAVLSLLPFVRPEYAAFAPCAILWVVWRGQWRALPWALVGILIYCLASAVLLHRPLAFFTDRLYVGNDLYGHGGPDYFYENLHSTLGYPLKKAAQLSILILPLLWWLDPPKRSQHLLLTVMTLIPALGIFALHSYAWWKGGMGSMGLLRVMATLVPLLCAFTAYALSSLWDRAMFRRVVMQVLAVALLLIYTNMSYHEMRRRLPLPFHADAVQRALEDAAEQVKARLDSHRLFFSSPYIAVLCQVDPWDPARAQLLNGSKYREATNAMRKGDLVVWEPHIAGFESGLPLDTLIQDPHLEKIVEIVPPEPTMTMGNVPFIVVIFQCAHDP